MLIEQPIPALRRHRPRAAARSIVATTPSAGPHDRAATDRGGRLIVLVCADAGRLDVVLGTIRRRLASDQRLAFIDPFVTRALPAGGGVPISSADFAAHQAGGRMALSWSRDGARYGYGSSVVARLASGTTVVIGASCDAAAQARSLWADSKIIRLAVATDTLRQRLSPRACLSRLTRPRTGGRALDRLLCERIDAVVHDSGEVADTLRAACDAIGRFLPQSGEAKPAEQAVS